MALCFVSVAASIAEISTFEIWDLYVHVQLFEPIAEIVALREVGKSYHIYPKYGSHVLEALLVE